MENRATVTNPSSNTASSPVGGLVPMDHSIASTRDDHEDALIAEIQSLHQTIRDQQHAFHALQEKLQEQGKTIQAISETSQLGQMAVKQIQEQGKTIQAISETARLGQIAVMQIQDDIHFTRNDLDITRNDLLITRNDLLITRNDVSKVTEKQEQLASNISALQRGMKCLDKLLGLRRFRQVVNANRGEASSTVLEQQGRKIGTMLSWFERMSMNDFRPEEMRSFFEKHKGGRGKVGNNSDAQAGQEAGKEAGKEGVYIAAQTTEGGDMEVEEEDELKIHM
ncbi:hypothetical protein C8A00DRAFT_30575 [Chaetomidium leptoderma]|uniref:Uncharacterized protein n=1 Tax=Chaetomidium leptoderma TaxID=669021 RepID=A0AAN7A196_9PEZI|nr:hypothetical protein C8A00DRAFT_30575 [Chaetomidium leptoderma]